MPLLRSKQTWNQQLFQVFASEWEIPILTVLALLLAACAGEAPAPTPAPTPQPEPTSEPVEEPAEEPAEEPTEEPAQEEAGNTIVDIAVADGRFTTLVAAVQAAGLADTLSGDGAYTVFAPTDDAFAALPEGTIDTLLADPEGALTDILLYHVVDGTVMAETVVTLDSAPTLQGEEVTITVADGNVFMNGEVQVIMTDIEASNGVIHVIDGVLLPPSTMAEELPTIAEIAASDEDFSTLVTALDAAGLVETLDGEGSFTVFAPTNDAFAALPEGTVEALLADPEGALADILLYHAVDGAFLAEDVVTLDAITTLLGEDVTITVDNGNVYVNESVQIIAVDIQASNGVIHAIDAVLIPAS